MQYETSTFRLIFYQKYQKIKLVKVNQFLVWNFSRTFSRQFVINEFALTMRNFQQILVLSHVNFQPTV